MPRSFPRGRSSYAGELSSLPPRPLRSAASIRISSSILATRGVRRGGPSGMTTRGPRTEPGLAAEPAGPVAAREAGEVLSSEVADARSGLIHGSGPPTEPRQRAEGASPIPPPRLPVPPTRELTSRNPPGGGKEEMVAVISTAPDAGDSRPRDSHPSRARRTRLLPRTSSALACHQGRVLTPTTGHVESNSFDAESRSPAQTT